MRCKILKSFPFTRDGFTMEEAVEGEFEDIPADLISGLEKEKMVQKAPSKAAKAKANPAPDKKMDEAPLENKSTKAE
ncbi:hypothetical protein [Ruegeria sp.]|uniref:hypothetical protein n=1 Tax=Ruegeria sp. TaxID=1879320 RepID=UPI003B59D37D